MSLLLSYLKMTIRLGFNYVNQTRELRLLAAIGIVVYVLCSLVMGVTFSNSMSQTFHESAPEIFSSWFNRRLTWGVGFIAVVTLLATIATLFQSAQRDELERLRLLPIPDLPFFSMRVLDICLGVLLFFPLLVALPILRFCALESLSLPHACALLAGIVLVTLQICFVHMTLAVFAAWLVPERMVQNKGILYLFLAILAVVFYVIAVVAGKRQSDFSLLAGIEAALPGKILLYSIQGEAFAAWTHLFATAAATAALGTGSYLCYSRLYLRRFDLLMDKLVAENKVDAQRPTVPERLVAWSAPALRRLGALILPSPGEAENALALVRKELRSVLRDPSVHLVLFFALLFIALPGIFFSAREPWLGLQVLYFLSVGTALVLNAVLAVSSIGREGLGLSLVAHLPVRTEAILFAKAFAAFLLNACLSVPLALGALLLPLDWPDRLVAVVYGYGASVSVGAVLAFLSTGLGAIFPKFDAKNQFLAVNRFGVAIFFGLATLLTVSAAAAFVFPVLFGPLWLAVPAFLLAIWAYVAGVLYLEGSRRLRDLMALV